MVFIFTPRAAEHLILPHFAEFSALRALFISRLNRRLNFLNFFSG